MKKLNKYKSYMHRSPNQKIKMQSLNLVRAIPVNQYRPPNLTYRNLQTEIPIPCPQRKISTIPGCVTAINPKSVTQESQETTCHLTPWGLSLLSTNYMQMGFLYKKPPHLEIETIVDHLRDSLSQTLTHFFPLAGRLETKAGAGNAPSYSISINCSDSPGVEFKFAVADGISLDDVAFSPSNTLVDSLYPLNGAINNDGHMLPLLAVQVTKLVDGIFICCSLNHSISDGTGFNHFMNTWSEMSFRLLHKDEKYEQMVTAPPIIKNWAMSKQQSSIINLPSDYYDDIHKRIWPPQPLLHGQLFQFSAKSIAKLRAQANAEGHNNISSMQSFTAFLWRCITRARQLPSDQETSCIMAVSDRLRVKPRVPEEQFGCYVQTLDTTTTVGELMSNSLGKSAGILHSVVTSHTAAKVHKHLEDWLKNPNNLQIPTENLIVMGSSPRFRVYEIDFGWGKPVAFRGGHGNKADGTMFIHQGSYGRGSIGVEIFLSPPSMNALTSDKKFMELVSPAPH